MNTHSVDRLTAVLLILAGAAAPGAAFTYQLGTYGFLGAACFVLTLIYIVHKNLPDANAPTTDEAPAMSYAATGPTEWLDQRFPDVYPEIYAREVTTGRLLHVIAVEAATWATERLDEVP